MDIFQLSLAKGSSPELLVRSGMDKFDARVSADGRAIAFAAADGTGRKVYVAPLPVTSTPVLVAVDVSSTPRWGPDGRLYYVDGASRMTAVAVRTQPSLVVGAAQPLFELTRPVVLFDVSRDGRFLLFVPTVRAAERPIAVATSAVTGRP